MSDELRAQLRKSVAVTSLLTEQRVAEDLRKRGWNAVHGFFYQDQETSKHREVDVAATMYKTVNEGDLIDETRLTLVAECKSGMDSNIITIPYSYPDIIPSELDLTPIVSTGGNAVNRIKADLRAEIPRRYVVPDAIEAYNRLLQRYSDYLTHEESVSLGLWIAPPPAPHITTAYRETSGIKEKELENSVLWRAFLSVYSAIEALQAGFLDYVSGYVGQVFDEALLQDRNLWKALSLALSSGLGMRNIFHPVIVTHAKLWVLTEGDLVEVPQFRFLQVNSLGMPFRWVDVVRADMFEEFSATTTEHYRERLMSLESTTQPPTPAGMLFRFLTETE